MNIQTNFQMLEVIQSPWPWYVAGPAIALTMYLLLYFGRNFGVSSTLRTGCAIGGAGRINKFFCIDWRGQLWNIVFVMGGVAGGIVAVQFLGGGEDVALSQAALHHFQEMGISQPGAQLAPREIFSWEGLTTPTGLLMIAGGGFLVGFGSRYAGGCTSGHAISGLSDLQWPSLVAVIGFFIGGLFITYMVMPHLL